tara:strand:+ start:239 stop:481 length:243 start_codon:yes stop_codon:yes gene_type:complete
MLETSPTDDTFFLLSKAVEDGDPNVAKRIKTLLNNSDDPSEMRYLEGLLLLLGEQPGELEDAPDIENDPDEYGDEYCFGD